MGNYPLQKSVKDLPKCSSFTNVPVLTEPKKFANVCTTFSDEEVTMLRESFEDLKRERDEVALQALQRIAIAKPDVIPIIQAAKAGYYSKMDNWEQLGLGIILLSGIERCLLRLDRPEYLENFFHALVTKHESVMMVPRQLMQTALAIATPVIFDSVKRRHHGNSVAASESIIDDRISQCKLCLTWQKFFFFFNEKLGNARKVTKSHQIPKELP